MKMYVFFYIYGFKGIFCLNYINLDPNMKPKFESWKNYILFNIFFLIIGMQKFYYKIEILLCI